MTVSVKFRAANPAMAARELVVEAVWKTMTADSDETTKNLPD
jgi:hypothetical protein